MRLNRLLSFGSHFGVRQVAILAMVILTACRSDPAPEPTAKQAEETIDPRRSSLQNDKCYRFDEVSRAYEFLGYRSCVEFLPPQQMKGVWITEFEGSAFLPATDIGLPKGTRIWLEETAAMNEKARAPKRRYFEIEIIGRRASRSGQYGHLGGAEQLVVVDRLISMREIAESEFKRRN